MWVLLLWLTSVSTALRTGLIYMPDYPVAGNIIAKQSNNFAYSYNYHSRPSPNLRAFVPMLMGKPAPGQDFAAEILALRERPQHVMFFNEPDMPTSVGGSSLSPARAAQIMKTEGRKLSAAGIKIVFAGTTSNQNGDQWRAQFKVECAGECPSEISLESREKSRS